MRDPSFIEARLLLVPSEAGGRTSIVVPREGSYMPLGRTDDGSLFRLRLIEGPPRIAPGEEACVLAEVDAELAVGVEADLIDLGARVVGLMTVTRVFRPGA